MAPHMLNIEDPKQAEQIPAIWRLGFRPFFLGGALFALIAIPVWLFSIFYSGSYWFPVLPIWWHPHELLFGFGMAIVAGFLLTAVQTWTGYPGMKGHLLTLSFPAGQPHAYCYYSLCRSHCGYRRCLIRCFCCSPHGKCGVACARLSNGATVCLRHCYC